jgi:hypothetical protein
MRGGVVVVVVVDIPGSHCGGQRRSGRNASPGAVATVQWVLYECGECGASAGSIVVVSTAVTKRCWRA